MNKLTFLFLFWISSLQGQTLKLNIHGIRNEKGNIRLVFYTNSKSFEEEKPLMVKIIPKTSMKGGTLSVSYSGLKSGTYGVAILDDENANDKMDYGMILPKEGYGFSNYYHTGMTRPKFESFGFVLDKDNVSVEIKVRYL